MIKFAIRDDDTSYFTNPEEIDRIYRDIWEVAPVSLAIVPFAVRSYNCGKWNSFYQEDSEINIDKNKDMISFLIEKIKEDKLHLMCHGFNHKYHKTNNKNFIPEYVWKSPERLDKETKIGKDLLSSVFKVDIKTFVPPSNAISKKALSVVCKFYPYIFMSIPLKKIMDIQLNKSYIEGYIKRLYYQLKFNLPYPFLLDFKSYKIHPSYSLTPQVSFNDIKKKFDICLSIGANFCIATHHWELSENPILRDNLLRLIEYATKKNCIFSNCDDLFQEENQ